MPKKIDEKGETAMGRIIAVANQKGGVGKTTTTINLSSSLAEKGYKVLVVDMDPQGNATGGLGIEKNELDKTLYELLREECTIEECVTQSVVENLLVIPSNRQLAGIELEFIGQENMQYVLKEKLDGIKGQYDFIVIDCPPALGTLTINAMTATHSVIVPIQCEFYALDGLSQLIYTLELVKESLNPDLKIDGILFTMYDGRTNLSVQVVENVREHLDQPIYKTLIPRNVRLAEAPSHGLPITLYAPKSIGAERYRELADEVIKKKKGKK